MTTTCYTDVIAQDSSIPLIIGSQSIAVKHCCA